MPFFCSLLCTLLSASAPLLPVCLDISFSGPSFFGKALACALSSAFSSLFLVQLRFPSGELTIRLFIKSWRELIRLQNITCPICLSFLSDIFPPSPALHFQKENSSQRWLHQLVELSSSVLRILCCIQNFLWPL